jgi:hypothetical protein
MRGLGGPNVDAQRAPRGGNAHDALEVGARRGHATSPNLILVRCV